MAALNDHLEDFPDFTTPTQQFADAVNRAGKNRVSLAVAFSAAGFRVFPQDRNKRGIKGFPEIATTEANKIRHWSKKYPRHNFAGYIPAGWVVLDVDIKGGVDGFESLGKLSAGEVSPTLTVRTGSGGEHRYYKTDSHTKSGDLDGFPGLEIKVGGTTSGWITLPGAIYADGREYTVTHASEPAPAPAWLETVKTKGTAVPAPSSAAPVNESISQGERNRTLTSLAGTMQRRGMGQEAITSALLAENAAKCNPPLPDVEVQEIARSVGRYAAENRAGTPEQQSNVERPEIWAADQHIAIISAAAWEAIKIGNYPKRLFTLGSTAMRMTENGELQLLTPDRLHYEIERAAYWYHKGTGKFEGVQIKAKAPRVVVSDMLSYPQIPLPPLRKIVGAPCFDADGNLCADGGYHNSGIYIDRESGLPDLPETGDAIALLDDLITDFPFQDRADRANAFAFLLTPFVRDLITGSTPAHLLEAQIHGTGKTLLAEILFEISTGGKFEVTTPSYDEDELRKRITSLLIAGSNAIMIDNLEDMISSTIASALTAPKWTDRILGKNETITIPNTTVFALSGNNVSLSGEMARRVVRIRLQAKSDKPWERSGFRHPNIKTYVIENRAKLQAACISLVTAWLNAGRPNGPHVPFGSFESYAATLGGILHQAGIEGFLANRSAVFEESDTEGAAWRAFTESWFEKWGTAKVTTSDIFGLALDTEGFLLDGKNDQAIKTALGIKLRKFKDRIYGKYQIKKSTETKSRAILWQLKQVGGEPYEPYEPCTPRAESKNSTELRPEPSRGSQGSLYNDEEQPF